jgi:toxin ParE1/3/4
VHLSNSADSDFGDIVAFTAEKFGARQAVTYQRTLKLALNALVAGPEVRGSSRRDDISIGLRTLHVARKGRRGRHLILYRASPERIIIVLRILHDAMDLARHVPSEE